MDEVEEPQSVPEGEFWDWAYHPSVLRTICRLREGLLLSCKSDARKALRAVIMGALHGPMGRSIQSYFSNQCPRTYAPKPVYSVKYWRSHGMLPFPVDVLAIIAERANRYYGGESSVGKGRILRADSREGRTYSRIRSEKQVKWVVTSPPYYGMRTYVPDQWLRMWFVGGGPAVDYSNQGQLAHSSPTIFAEELRKVWRNSGRVCAPGARLVVRFGGINDRRADPMGLLGESLLGTDWRVTDIVSAGTASDGRRQSLHFSAATSSPVAEFDVWATWQEDRGGEHL